MRQRPRLCAWAICVLVVMVTVAAVPAHASTAREGHVDLVIQPVLSAGGEGPSRPAMEALTDAARDWLSRVSQGRTSLGPITVRAPIEVATPSCHDLAAAVASARQSPSSLADSRVLYVGQSADCPYLGLAETPGRWILMPSLDADARSAARTLAHELGHTFGLQHAGAEACPILTDLSAPTSRSCGVDEYGDRTDTMGRGELAWGLGPLTLAQVGWGDGLTEVSAPGSHMLEVKPLAAEGTDGIAFTDPVTGDRYALAYRSPGEAAGDRVETADPAAGAYLYRLPRVDEEQVGSVLVPWLASLTRPRAGKPGFAFVAPSGAVSLRVDALTGRAARVTLSLDPSASLADRTGPVFAEGRPRLDGGILRIPRAVDQSGIRAYTILVDGKAIQRLAPRQGNISQTVALRASVRGGLTIAVTATDLQGNATTVEVARG